MRHSFHCLHPYQNKLDSIIHIVYIYNMNYLEAFYKYLEFEKRYSPHTLAAYKNDLNQLQTYLNNTYEFDNLLVAQHIHIRSWIVYLMQQDYSAKAVNRKISTLKSFYKHAKRKSLITRNPMLKIIAPKVGKRLPSYIQHDKIERIISKQDQSDFSIKRDELIIEILYCTGIRRAELIYLKENDIDPYKMQLKVLGKGNKERIIPFPRSLMGHITSYKKLKYEQFEQLDHPYLIVTDKGRQLYPKFAYNKVKAYLSRITTIDKKSPHILRHSYATHLVNNGAKLNAVKALLGHSSLAATQVYTHNTVEKLKKAYQKAHPKA